MTRSAICEATGEVVRNHKQRKRSLPTERDFNSASTRACTVTSSAVVWFVGDEHGRIGSESASNHCSLLHAPAEPGGG